MDALTTDVMVFMLCSTRHIDFYLSKLHSKLSDLHEKVNITFISLTAQIGTSLFVSGRFTQKQGQASLQHSTVDRKMWETL